MNNFTFYSPTLFTFGDGEEKNTGALVRRFGGSRVLLVTGGGSVRRNGAYDAVTASLEAAGIPFTELSDVQANPRSGKVYEGIDLVRRTGADFLLALGGGSVIDTAKAIGYGLANDGDVWDFYEHTRQASACLPIGVVLTIAASGSEMSNSSVITNDETLEKRGYNNDISRPVFAVMNPEITMTLPPYQTACGCTDILMHTMERYFTNGGNMEITDAIAEGLMRTVITNAKILVDDPDNYDARAEVMWSGSLSHNGLTGCGNDGGDFASHLLEHEIGGMFDVAHGAGLAAIWGSWARYVIDSCTPRFAKFAVNVMGVEPGKDDMETGLKGIKAMEDFYRAISMPTNLKELGIDPTEEQLETMAKNARIAAGGPKGSAKKLEAEDMLKIYQMAAGK